MADNLALPIQYADPLPDAFDLGELVRATVTPHFQTTPTQCATKPDGSWVTELDHQLQDNLQNALQIRYPQYGFIGEEMEYASQKAVCDDPTGGYWVLDPLDGTTNFRSGFLCYGVSLALVVDGRARLGVVFDPVRNETFCAKQGRGAFLNQRRLANPSPTHPRLQHCIAIVDYKRLVGDLAAQLVRCPPYRSQRNLGSSVLEWCWLAAGRAHLYLHGGQKLWDFAAGVLILEEAGGAAVSLSGKPLDCTRLRKRAVAAASCPELLSQWRQWIARNTPRSVTSE